jgi:AraC-like DNA-binding protein
MKVLPFTIIKPKKDTLILQEDKEAVFYSQLHQHEEYQISYIKKGEGALIVGNTINRYKEGDLIIFGSNLPHVFNSDNSNIKESHMITLFFKKDSFGKGFFEIEELKQLQLFFNKAENGIKIKASKEFISVFESLFIAKKMDRFILFLSLLKLISKAKSEPLSSFVTLKKFNDNEGKRMSAVYNYTLANYQKEISLTTISQEAAMTKNAFCKYFKKRTNKTFTTFLNELRIEKSCNLLRTNKELTIAEIAELSGFQNISNFNRKFKQFIGSSPRVFRKDYIK